MTFMKRMAAMLLALMMVLCFAACGEEATNDGDDAAASATVDLEAKFGIDLNGAGEQKMSDDRATADVLTETKNVWLEGKMTFALDSNPKTYEDFVEHIGCDATHYTNVAEDGERHFVWVAEGDDTAQLLAVFWETPQGWTLYSVGATNLG